MTAGKIRHARVESIYENPSISRLNDKNHGNTTNGNMLGYFSESFGNLIFENSEKSLKRLKMFDNELCVVYN